jgi:hypothetical protein
MQVDNENFEEKFWLQSMYMNRYEYLWRLWSLALLWLLRWPRLPVFLH